MDVAPIGVLLKEKHKPGPENEGSGGGDEHPEEAVVLQDRLRSQRTLVKEEGHLLDPDDVPALEGGHHHGQRLHPSPLEIAATFRGDHETHQVLQ